MEKLCEGCGIILPDPRFRFCDECWEHEYPDEGDNGEGKDE